ncbi:MAG: hypothetical protein U1E05_22750 [Patescibacteria group bacterium]|nr:hypothetical protein [Patescibacteria group bacterium]
MSRLIEHLLFGAMASLLGALIVLDWAVDISRSHSRVFGDVVVLVLALHLTATRIFLDRNRLGGSGKSPTHRIGRLLNVAGCAVVVLLVVVDLVLDVATSHPVYMHIVLWALVFTGVGCHIAQRAEPAQKC